jgi:bifunctional enzyme CysN/CysC/sulfate adenylyltransferase subunit 1
VTLSFSKPIAVAAFHDNSSLGRFVMVDGYNAAGGGIVTQIIGDGENTDASPIDYVQFEEELFALLKRHFPHRFS